MACSFVSITKYTLVLHVFTLNPPIERREEIYLWFICGNKFWHFICNNDSISILRISLHEHISRLDAIVEIGIANGIRCQEMDASESFMQLASYK